MNEFLMELAELMRKHEATLTYTKDDDGIHIIVNGEKTKAWLDENPADELLKLAKKTKQPHLSGTTPDRSSAFK
ncbi:hypothetical protein OKZ62_001737 [Vibrio navarrensis]|nr:hypothetical protein [Vibrio navarrensis]